MMTQTLPTEQPTAPPKRLTAAKLWQVVQEEASGLHLRLLVAQALLAPLPPYSGSRVRAAVLRRAGFQIGTGTLIWGMPRLTGGGNLYQRLVIGGQCVINIGCHFDLEASITIGDHAAIGHQVLLLTSTHQIGPAGRRAARIERQPVVVGTGAWLGARCTVLPGVQIGAGAIVAAGALVHRDVAPNTMVAGVPARVVRAL